MVPRLEKCMGNCRRDSSVGQTIFQAYEGGYWSTPYITPDTHRFLGNWCVACFQRDLGHLISSQAQPYVCTICEQPFAEHDAVIYVTLGIRPLHHISELSKEESKFTQPLAKIVGKNSDSRDCIEIYKLLS